LPYFRANRSSFYNATFRQEAHSQRSRQGSSTRNTKGSASKFLDACIPSINRLCMSFKFVSVMLLAN
jgi:hypothetical protein